MKSSLPIERQQSHIRRGVAHLQFAVAPLRQRVAQKPIDVAWPAHHVTERPVPARQNCNQNYGRPFPPTHQFTSFRRLLEVLLEVLVEVLTITWVRVAVNRAADPGCGTFRPTTC